MGDFFAELLKTFTEPGRKPFSALVLVLAGLAVGIGCVLVYERYTASFRLSRLQKEVDLLSRLIEVEKSGETNNLRTLEKARAALVNHAVQTMTEPPMTLEYVPSRLTVSMDSLWKFFAAGFFWWAYLLFQLPKLKTEEGRRKILEPLFVACVAGFIGMFVPPIWWPWFHILIVPLLIFAFILVLLIPIVVLYANFTVAKNRAQANACINNLRQIDGAIQQWALENRKKEDAIPTEIEIAKYLKDRVLPKCPSGGKYTISTVAAAPTCTFEGHKLP